MERAKCVKPHRITRPCRPTLYALSVCMNGRAAHFIMQTAIAYSAADGGVMQRNMSDMEIQFDTPNHGWMEVHVSDGATNSTIVFSDVPCNSLEQAIHALLKIKDGSSHEVVEFSLEPEYAMWEFRSYQNTLVLSVYPGAVREKPIVFECLKAKALQRLYIGLRDLELNPCWNRKDALESVWSWEFPSADLNRYVSG